jgi:glycogen synthase
MTAILSPLDNREKTILNKRKMSLLILCWEYPPNVIGGLSRHVHGLSVQLAAQGHNIHVLTAGNGELPLFERKEQVNIHRVYPLNNEDNDFLSWIGGLNLAIAQEAEKLAEKIKFDLIHAHDWLLGSASIVLKELLSLPLISTIHATEHGRNNGIHTELQQFIHNKEHQLISESDQVIVCSQYMKEELMTIFELSDEHISVLPNGIEPLYVELNYKEVFPELKQKKYIFSMGRMVREKGFETLIDAAAIVKERGQDLSFVIAGNGPMLETYRRIVIDQGLENFITFIGYVTDEQRNALIFGSEIAVFPSYYEPFGIVALETMIFGKPTIVSDTGGLKGIVTHLDTGMLMTPKDAVSLLEQVAFLLQYPKTALKIGNKGREIVKRLYSWKRIAADTCRLMEDILLTKIVFRDEGNGTETPKIDKKV